MHCSDWPHGLGLIYRCWPRPRKIFLAFASALASHFLAAASASHFLASALHFLASWYSGLIIIPANHYTNKPPVDGRLSWPSRPTYLLMFLCNFSRFRGARMQHTQPSASSSASAAFPPQMSSSSSSSSSTAAAAAAVGHNRRAVFGTNPPPQRYPTASMGIDHHNSAVQQKQYSSVHERHILSVSLPAAVWDLSSSNHHNLLGRLLRSGTSVISLDMEDEEDKLIDLRPVQHTFIMGNVYRCSVMEQFATRHCHV